jgi:hypothetical protein
MLGYLARLHGKIPEYVARHDMGFIAADEHGSYYSGAAAVAQPAGVMLSV